MNNNNNIYQHRNYIASSNRSDAQKRRRIREKNKQSQTFFPHSISHVLSLFLSFWSLVYKVILHGESEFDVKNDVWNT